jgi:hypothetical protein
MHNLLLQLKLPVNSSRFNGLIAVLGIASLFCGNLTAEIPGFSREQVDWIAARIFANECSSDVDCLTAWNAGEDFPSLGLGHFIWYRAEQQEIYTETFPALLHYYREQDVPLPEWLADQPDPESPWQNREQFQAAYHGDRLTGLREFLLQTLPVQAGFIMQRQETALNKILAHARADQREAIASLYRDLAAAAPPYGRYALIDYVNFKGEGIAPAERYQGQGWGLLQVLQEMLDDPLPADLPIRFRNAAAEVLTRRVANAPPARDEQRWLRGWLNRLDTYLPPD